MKKLKGRDYNGDRVLKLNGEAQLATIGMLHAQHDFMDKSGIGEYLNKIFEKCTSQNYGVRVAEIEVMASYDDEYVPDKDIIDANKALRKCNREIRAALDIVYDDTVMAYSKSSAFRMGMSTIYLMLQDEEESLAEPWWHYLDESDEPIEYDKVIETVTKLMDLPEVDGEAYEVFMQYKTPGEMKCRNFIVTTFAVKELG